MPVVKCSYRSPWSLSHGHLETILPAIFRQVPVLTSRRERIETPDADFLDLDWTTGAGNRVVILSHGLEGSSQAPYVQGMARAFVKRGWEVHAWNCRGCSGEMNRQLRFYHSGSSDDLRTVVRHVLAQDRFRAVALVGFSLGGNMTLKFLGEEGDGIDPRISGGVAFSVPCDLAASSRRLEAAENRIYMGRFLESLRRKVLEKAERFPGAMNLEGLEAIRTFKQFDDQFTAPLHGFTSAEDYWARAGSQAFLPRIRVPALLVNARNDPFLAGGCFPVAEAEANPHFYLEMPSGGGHVGFWTGGPEYWSETRAAEFLSAVI